MDSGFRALSVVPVVTRKQLRHCSVLCLEGSTLSILSKLQAAVGASYQQISTVMPFGSRLSLYQSPKPVKGRGRRFYHHLGEPDSVRMVASTNIGADKQGLQHSRNLIMRDRSLLENPWLCVRHCPGASEWCSRFGSSADRM